MKTLRQSLFVFVLLLTAWPAQAALSVSPSALTFTASGSQTVRLTQSGKKANWTVTVGVPWITVTPMSGRGSATLTVTVAAGGLTGINTSVVYIRSSSNTTTVSVTFEQPSTPPPPPPLPSPTTTTGVFGPQASITCTPTVQAGQSIQTAINAAAAGATICVGAGTYNLTAPLLPKANQVLQGNGLGVVLDGLAMSSTSGAALIKGQCGTGVCSGVTVRNFVLRNVPGQNCTFLYQGADNWRVEYNEVYGCSYGLNFGYNDGVIFAHNKVHNNAGNVEYSGGYGGNSPTNCTFDSNEFYQNNRTQKITGSTGCKWVNNYIHNEANGTWMDGDNTQVLIENNLYEDISEVATYYEISGAGVIRNNTYRRVGTAVFKATSRDVETYGNTIEDAWRGIQDFVQCDRIIPAGTAPYSNTIDWDLRNNYTHDNTIRVGTRAGSYASLFSGINCTSTQIGAYLNGSKQIRYEHNAYAVPDVTAAYWLWNDINRTFAQWQAIPQDATGTVIPR